MSIETDEFFKGKRAWSRIKDKVLSSYMSPYIAKVASKGQPLLLIDAFAGPGIFGDHEAGSPLIMCQAAQKFARGRYKAIFVNEKQEYHDKLTAVLQKANFSPAATAVLGDSRDLLRAVAPTLTSQSVFLYLDPFGLKDCEFETLKPFLTRDKRFSTEIWINLCAPALHRLAARDAIKSGTGDADQIARWHTILTKTLGGDYWREALLSDNLDTKVREQMVVEGYEKRLASTGYLTYTGSCPVQASRDSRTKYYMIFASGHPDAMVVLNDEMCKAFNEYMHEQETKDTLFAGQPWTAWRDTSHLVDKVVDYVNEYSGETRKSIWLHIVKDHFMQYTRSEYLEAVTKAFKSNLIDSPTIRPTKRLNDNCALVPRQP